MHSTEVPHAPQNRTAGPPFRSAEESAHLEKSLQTELPEWRPLEDSTTVAEKGETRLDELELKQAIESLIDPKLRFNIAGKDFVANVGGDEHFDEDILRFLADGGRLFIRNMNDSIDRALPRRWISRWLFVMKSFLLRRHYQVHAVLRKIPFQVRELALVRADGAVITTVGREIADNKLDDLLRSGAKAARPLPGKAKGKRAWRKQKADTFARLAYLVKINRNSSRHLVLSRGKNFAFVAIVQGVVPRGFEKCLRFAVTTIERKLPASCCSGDDIPESTDVKLKRHLTRVLHLSKRRLEVPFPWVQIAATVLTIALLTGLGFAGHTAWKHYRWNQLVASISRLPGVEISHHSAWVQPYLVTGFKDPIAPDPVNIIGKFGFDESEIDFDLAPHLSRHPVIVEQRTRRLLQPPSSVSLRFHGGRVVATGHASNDWFAHCAEQRATLPGDLHIDLSAVTNTDLESCTKLVQELTRQRIPFNQNEVSRPRIFDHDLKKITGIILALQKTAHQTGINLEINLVGRHSINGGRTLDGSLLSASQKRADNARALLLSTEPKLDSLTLRPIGERPLGGGTPNANARNEAVEFIINLQGKTFRPDEVYALGASAN